MLSTLFAGAFLVSVLALMWRRAFPSGSGSLHGMTGVKGWVNSLSGLIAAVSAWKFAATYSREHDPRG